MHKGKLCTVILTIMAFLAGIMAPVPECYVFRVVCPLKTSFAAETPSCAGGSCPARATPCCSKATVPADLQNRCNLAGFKPRMKSYLPDIETVAAPAIPLALLPSLFHVPFASKSICLPHFAESRGYSPDPIPILLRKQSLLI